MIKQLLKYINQYKKDSILTPIYVTFQVAMEIVIPILMSNLIDFGIDNGDMSYIPKIGCLLLLCAFIALLLGCLAGRSAAIASAGFARNLRQQMYYNVQNFSFLNIDKFSTSSIITRLTTDVTNVQNAYQMIIFTAVRSPIMLISSLAMSFYINAKLSIIFVICIPILGFGLYIIVRKAHPIFTRVFRTYDKLNTVVEENLSGIRVVKTFNRESYESKKFFAISEKIYNGFLKATKLVALHMPLMQFCMYGCIILISWFGSRIIVNCKNDASTGLSTGQLMSLIIYATQILMSLMILSMVLVMITIAISSAKRIVELLNEESDLKNCYNPLQAVPNGDIYFENVSFSYVKDKNKLCLNNINLKINSGEVIGITGSTGSAKSTLVQLIPRLYDTTAGTIYVGGHSVREYDIKTLRNEVSVVLQKNTLFSETIKENLKWGNENASDDEILKACKSAQANEFIESLPQKYDTFVEQNGTNFSGGQKQRLCIARALLKKPKILILDDSTSSVDTKTDALIRQAFKREIPGTTKIIISQRISSVKDADKIIVMDNGKIIAFDKHENLIRTCCLYREVYESQEKGGNSDE
ncbi:MAG: ABC transporter ATP-binding protein/permease [Eubacteriales bacterium SKADARSKE-1]|nr:ABC transporter ATP-binding protein/permease [Eubacteriales bacterium SKADARSKE-1]